MNPVLPPAGYRRPIKVNKARKLGHHADVSGNSAKLNALLRRKLGELVGTDMKEQLLPCLCVCLEVHFHT